MAKSPFVLTVQRHPRYTLALAAFVLCAYWFLSTPTLPPSPVRYNANNELQARLEREERKYRAMLPQRQELITRYGPTPAQVVMFPPDQDPWPPYTVWDFFPPLYNCPHELDRLGALGDGGKWICGMSRIQDKPDCVIYSFGIDSTYLFEATLLQSTRFCQVWIYDSTKGAGAEGHIPRALRHRAHFGKLALGASDRHGAGDEPKTWTLKSLMAENGHSHIDFLRLDVEGWEWETFRGIVRDFTMERGNPGGGGPHAPNKDNATSGWGVAEREGVLPFGQLQIELHVWNQRFQDFLEWWELLEVAGLRPFHNEINLVYANYNRHSGVELAEYSFINIRGENAFGVALAAAHSVS
ncbi:methyltransferase domain-containing protein [Dichomitus squalens]|uniref:Methyltransferase domain-containing protein n=1 Tax=Dichomitus squalens TaxID=114155 RepID=A0A4Q9PFQ1_9APHY|nr:methyltransferase domain-containing protein [Dichomitus squalens]